MEESFGAEALLIKCPSCLLIRSQRGSVPELDQRKLTGHKGWFRSFFFFLIFLFMAVLGLRFCARAFSSCGEQGPLFIAVREPLTIAASLVAEHRL